MIKEAFLGAVISNVTSLVKGKLKTRKSKKDIGDSVHQAFTQNANYLLPLCSDKILCSGETFSSRLFDLAKGQTVNARKLVDFGVEISKKKQLEMPRPEIIEALKVYSNRLLNIIEEFAPNTGDVPNSFNNFYQELVALQQSDSLSRSYPYSPKPVTPGTTPHNIPNPSTPKTFLGRENVLIKLHERLEQNTQVTITAVWGMGGIGKTELAIQHARSTLKTYPGGIIWINARTRSEDVGIQIVSFCEIWFKMNFRDEQKLEDRVKCCWADWTPSGDVLIIFDDVHDYTRIEPFLPPQPSRFKTLVTTRLNLTGADTLPLDVLDEDFALKLLREWIGRERIKKEKDTAKELCSRLGYLPLALQLVGNYLSGRNISLSEMIKRLAEKGLEHQSLDVHETDQARALKIKRGVKAAFELTWNDLSDNGRQLGCLLSLFAQAPILWEMIKRTISPEELEDNETALSELRNWHLLQGENPYRLHQLTREFFREKLSISNDTDQQKQGYASAMAEAASKIPQSITIDQVEEFSPYIPHISEVAENLYDYIDDDNFDWPFIGLGKFYRGQGFFTQAEPWYKKCLEVCKNRFEDEHPSVATSLNNLALLYDAQGRYEEAEPLHQRALKIREKVLGPEHPSVATSLNNLAGLYDAQGRYEEAEPLYQRALKISEKVLGPEHPSVATSLNNLAGLYDAQGRYDEAEPLLKRALRIREKVLGPEHPNTKIIKGNLESL